METLTHRTARASRPTPFSSSPRVFVACSDAATQDVLVLWLERAGYRVSAGLPDGSAEGMGDESEVLFTDRFGPGLAGEVVIGDLKAAHPRLQVVVIGQPGAGQSAQLSLARVAGADATLPTPLDRLSVLASVDPGG